jgi:hypothetical protein
MIMMTDFLNNEDESMQAIKHVDRPPRYQHLRPQTRLSALILDPRPLPTYGFASETRSCWDRLRFPFRVKLEEQPQTRRKARLALQASEHDVRRYMLRERNSRSVFVRIPMCQTEMILTNR